MRILRGVQHILTVVAAFLPFSISIPISSERQTSIQRSLPLNKRQSGFISVLGAAAAGDGSIHPRLEIRELERNADQWNIYLLGLRRMQAQPQSDKLSYYQIAGIHGRPYISWDGVGVGPPGSGGGYCPHASNIFPPWHRPYVALFEQALYLNARSAVEEFPNGELKERYTTALSTLRMPYWDWAAAPPNGGPALPSSMQRPTVELVMPNGTATVRNPLYSYTFHPLDRNELPDHPVHLWPSTLRSPSNLDANASSRNDLVSQTLMSLQPNFQSRIHSIFSSRKTYLEISNSRERGDSIESLHDTVHNAIGAGGHMSLLAYSSFDPAFWLHHVNVDRIFTIWQALHPEDYVTPHRNPFATWTYPDNSEADVDTPLYPFHRNDRGDFWTSASARSASTFGYTYPELVNLVQNSTSTLITRINELYGSRAEEDGDGEERRLKRGALAQPFQATSASFLQKRRIAGAANFSGKRKYTASIRLSRSFSTGAGKGSLNVYIFLGGKPASEERVRGRSEKWVREEGFVGVTGVLARGMGDMGSDGNSGDSSRPGAGVAVYGDVPLTTALEDAVRRGVLGSMREGDVGRFLARELRWRVASVTGEEVPVESVPSLQVAVLWAEVEPAGSASEFPRMVGEDRVLVQATDGRTGGFGKWDVL